VRPIDLHDVGEALWAIRKFGAAAQKNLAVQNGLTRLCADKGDGNAVARRAVRLNTAAIAFAAGVAAIVFAAWLPGSDLWMGSLSARSVLLWRWTWLSRLSRPRWGAWRLIGRAFAILIVPSVLG